MSYENDYETLLRGSLTMGRDRLGTFQSADFSQGEAYVSVLNRGDRYTVDWASEMRLKEVYESLEQSYPVDKLIDGALRDGQTIMIEPDSWNGVGHNQLSTVEFEYEDFKLEWRYSEIPEAEGRTKDLSMLTVHQNLDDRTQNVDHARNLYPLLTRKSLQPDSCRKVFQDVERFLSDPP